MPRYPLCFLCKENYCIERQAEFFAAQSVDQGTTIEWFPICQGHADGWNEGGDWHAPVFRLVISLDRAHNQS
jgi:hypothetical protein